MDISSHKGYTYLGIGAYRVLYFFEKHFFVFGYMSYSKSKNSDESSLEALFNMICAYKIGICNLNLEIDIDLYLLCLNLTAILTISWQMSATYKNRLDCVIYRPEGLSSIFICLIFYVLFSMCKYSFYCVLLDSQPSLR